MMNIAKSEKTLRKMIQKGGMTEDHFDSVKLWEVMKQFMGVQYKCYNDALLFQCGSYNFTGEDLYHFDFTRQFVVNKKKEYDHMMQLHLTIYYPKLNQLSTFKTHKWSFHYSTLQEFFDAVESLDEFIVTKRDFVPISFEISYEQV